MVTLSDAVDDTRGRVMYPLEAVQLPGAMSKGFDTIEKSDK